MRSLNEQFICGVSDKVLMPWLKDKIYTDCSDEGEAIAMGIGYYLATKKRATVFLSADGFCNALNPLTSHVIPYKIKMNLVISYGRTEPQHEVMTRILIPLIKLLNYDPELISIKLIQKI